MHGISLSGQTTQLWLNSKHEKSDNMPQVSLGNSSAESVVAEVATLTNDTKFSYHNVLLLKLLEETSLVSVLL